MNRGHGIHIVPAGPRTSAPPPPARGSRLFELVQVIREEPWQRQAACAGKPQKLWFGGARSGVNTYAEARLICYDCPVKAECLDDAMRNRIDEGMWGGKSPDERDELRRQQRAAGQTIGRVTRKQQLARRTVVPKGEA